MSVPATVSGAKMQPTAAASWISTGRSFASDPWGNMIAECKRKEEDLLIAELDLDEIKRARDILQFHRDRRVDSYGELMYLSIK